MALYAIEDDDLISAWDGEKGAVYWCLECFGPVKVRKGRNRFPHFYHLAPSPSCRLYSKSEDHLLLQVQLQKSLPPGEVQMETPLMKINRVADLLWEKKKLVFEIQCSTLYEGEATSRIEEYRKAGYEIVWILDDRVFNKRRLRPAEKFLRRHLAYFASLRRSAPSCFYDQFEIFHGERRIKKGKKIPINLQCIRSLQPTRWPAELPSQIENRIPNSPWYFDKDLIHRAILAHRYPSYQRSLQNWRRLEIHLQKILRRPNAFKRFFVRFIRDPCIELLDALVWRMTQ